MNSKSVRQRSGLSRIDFLNKFNRESIANLSVSDLGFPGLIFQIKSITWTEPDGNHRAQPSKIGWWIAFLLSKYQKDNKEPKKVPKERLLISVLMLNSNSVSPYSIITPIKLLFQSSWSYVDWFLWQIEDLRQLRYETTFQISVLVCLF